MNDAAPQSVQGAPPPSTSLLLEHCQVVDRYFVSSGSDPLSGIEWEERQSLLKESDGTSAKKGLIVVPDFFSVNASDVLCQKYLRRRGVPDLTIRVDEKTGIESWLSRSVPADGASFGGEKDLRQVIHRMAGCWAHWGSVSSLLTDLEARALYDESSYLLSRQAFAPNSPQWFNTGLYWAYGITGVSEGHFYVDPSTGKPVETKVSYERPQPQACFIQSVDDDLVNPGGIMDLWVREARLFKYGSGTGTNFSSIRGKGEGLSGGGQSSGLMSWLRIGDRSAAGIQSGGTTRRAAKMVILDVDHPEIEDFVSWKATEERKVAALVTGSKINKKAVDRVLEAIHGYQTNCVDREDKFDPKKNLELKKALREGRGMGIPDRLLVRAIDCAKAGMEFQPEVYGLDWRGEAYDTVSGQQSNNSVSISHRFMDSALSGGEWSLVERTTGKVSRTISALGLFDQICDSAWMCADPGLQFVDTMNEWNTCLGDGKIRGTNPCSEYVFLDDTACNLSSINLAFFLLPDGSFDLVGFESAVRTSTTILDISVSMASLPSAKIAIGTHNYRTLGLGFANLGALLMRMGIPYDSDEGRRIAAGITSFMTAVAYDQSGVMASRVGPFPRWEKNRESMTRVLENHRLAANGEEPIGVTCMPPRLDLSVRDRASLILDSASKMWDRAVLHASDHGYRNAQVTCIAPTGTIAIEMDCDTTGLEPDFALVKYKTLAGGGFMKQINLSVPHALRSLGYSASQIKEINHWVVGTGCLREEDRLMLLDRGLSSQSIARIEAYLSSSVHLRMALLPDVIGRDELERLQIDPSGDVASALGFSGKLLSDASAFSCGHQTVEGCPVLRDEHLPVFDCANRCGSGLRFIRPEGHLFMLSSIQPFLSGASSKTVNLPSEATQKDVKRVYTDAWKLGIKCVALYVDGSKFSQPLSSRMAEELFGDLEEVDASPSSFEHIRVVEKVVERIVERQVIRYISERRRLPSLRRGYTQKVLLGNHKVFLRTGEYPDGALGEIFVDIHKDGTAFKSLMGAFAIAVSVGLQHGVPLERFVDLFTFTKFEPNGPVQGDDRLMMCTSLLDWIFRHLAIRYLNREDLATIPKESAYDPQTVGDGESSWDSEKMMLAQTSEDRSADLTTDEVLISSPSPSKILFSGEYCDSCGNFSLVRKGRCSSCSNPSCGAESGGCG